MNIIILGPQGSGKGTQAAILAKKFNLAHSETGKILREKAETNPKLKEDLNNGVIVHDEETIGYVFDNLENVGVDYGNIVFDGSPRNVNQYNIINKRLGEKGKKIDLAIYLDISDSESVKRLSARRTCRNCGHVYNLVTNPPKSANCDDCGGNLIQREDDNEEAIKKRLTNYHVKTEPVLELAEKEGILARVNGERPIDEIAEEIASLIKPS